MRNQRGITLIALVITIIVLLILAGVSIAMLTGDNGILSNATKSVAETNIAEDRESATLDLSAAYSDFMEAKYVDNDSSATDFVAFLTAAKVGSVSGAKYLTDTAHYTVTTSGSTITITTVSKNNGGKKEQAIVDTDGGITEAGWTEVAGN